MVRLDKRANRLFSPMLIFGWSDLSEVPKVQRPRVPPFGTLWRHASPAFRGGSDMVTPGARSKDTPRTRLFPKGATGNFVTRILATTSVIECRAPTVPPTSDRKTKARLTASEKKKALFRR